MLDLFGEEVREPVIRDKGRRKSTQAKGFAAPPGTGPRGECCGSCAHAMPMRAGNKHFYKCKMAMCVWTHGVGTDIRLKWPACRFWEKPHWRR